MSFRAAIAFFVLLVFATSCSSSTPKFSTEHKLFEIGPLVVGNGIPGNFVPRSWSADSDFELEYHWVVKNTTASRLTLPSNFISIRGDLAGTPLICFFGNRDADRNLSLDPYEQAELACSSRLRISTVNSNADLLVKWALVWNSRVTEFSQHIYSEDKSR